MTILILGGTSEASELVSAIEGRLYIRAILSLAGRTNNPTLPQMDHRIGGFGGVNGLVSYIRKNNISGIICATHPFARQMPFNAQEAAKIANIPIIYLLRPAWKPQEGDQWIEVPGHQEAINHYSLMPNAERLNIFLTVGRMELSSYKDTAQHFYLVRTIDELTDKPLKNAVYLTDRPPFTVDKELALMREHKIDVVVAKNSGGEATKAKLIAAREMAIPVILIKRPLRPDGHHVETADEVIQWVMDRNDTML